MPFRVINVILLVLLVCAGCRSSSRHSGAETSKTRADSSSDALPVGSVIEDGRSDSDTTVEMLQVNNDNIYIEDVLEPLLPGIRERRKQLAPEELRLYIVDQIKKELLVLVEEALLFQEASKDITEQLDEVVQQYVDLQIRDRVNQEFGGRQSRYEHHLASLDMTLEDAREKQRRKLIVEHYLSNELVPRISSPTRQELWDYYHQNLETYTQQGKREFFLIDIPKNSQGINASESISEAWSRLQKGEAFEEVALAFSRGIHAADGGSWGFVKSQLQGRYEAVSNRFFELQEQEFSEIIETDTSFFIVKTGRVIPASTLRFEEVQPDLVLRYRNVEFEVIRSQLVRSLYDRAVITPREEVFLKVVFLAAVRYAEGMIP